MFKKWQQVIHWLKRQFKAVSFEAWTRDTQKAVRHYKFRAVPTDLNCVEYDVKVVRTRLGGNSQILHYRWSREKLMQCQSDSC